MRVAEGRQGVVDRAPNANGWIADGSVEIEDKKWPRVHRLTL
jgi:hypothetical protein